MKIFYIVIAVIAMACSKNHPVRSVTKVPYEPEYKKDQRLEKVAETTRSTNGTLAGSAATTVGTHAGESFRQANLKAKPDTTKDIIFDNSITMTETDSIAVDTFSRAGLTK